MVNVSDIAKAIGKVIQDLLIPELRAIKVELEHHSERFEKIDKRFEKIDERFEKIDERFEKIDKRFEKIFLELEELKIGQKEILSKLDLDKRITRVETIIESAVFHAGMVRQKQEKYKTK